MRAAMLPPFRPARSLQACLGFAMAFPALLPAQKSPLKRLAAPSLKKGEKQLFVDDGMILAKRGLARVVHPAKKLDHLIDLTEKNSG